MALGKAEKLIITLPFVIAAGVYLIFFDEILRTFGLIHWLALVGYVSIDIFLLLFLVFRYKRATIERLTGFVSAMALLALILDTLLGLPVSRYQTKSLYAISYLFGFGASGTGSSFGVSFAFLLLFLATASAAMIAAGRTADGVRKF